MKESRNWLRNVENVKEAKTVIHGDNVLVGVRLNNKSREEETKKNITTSCSSPIKWKKTLSNNK